MNRSLVISAVFTGILCGAWAGFAPLVNLSVWAGFAGCTAYFASGKSGIEGIRMTLMTNLLGVFTGFAMVWIGSNILGALPTNLSTGIGVGFVVMLIVLCGAIKWLAFVPGIFVGCYSYFGMDGDWKTLSLSLIAGVILGWACSVGGSFLSQKLTPTCSDRSKCE